MLLKKTGKFIARNVYIRKRGKVSNHQSKFLLEEPRKEEQNKPKLSRKMKIIKIGAEVNEIENRKTMEKINETKS